MKYLKYLILFTLITTSIQITYSATLTIPNSKAAPGDQVTIPIIIDNSAGIAGIELKVEFDPNILTAVEVLTTSITSGFTIVDSIGPGVIAISMAKATSLSAGSGKLIEIVFRVNINATGNESSSLIITRAFLYDDMTTAINCTTVNGLFTVEKILDISVMPNPFTPNEDGYNDEVVFLIPESSEIDIDIYIYDIYGRLIDELKSGNSRITWKGMSKEGTPQEPGIYFYHIKKGSNELKSGTITLIR